MEESTFSVQPGAANRRRTGVVMASALGALLAIVGVLSFPSQQADAQSRRAPLPAVAATPTYPLQQFPVQGPCAFIDTYGAPRSGGRSHEGVDIIARTGLMVYAVADGTLSGQYLAATAALAGNGWKLRKADGTYFFYAHLSAFAPGLAIGSPVVAGQVIGYIGQTGNAGSPHLHFEIHPGGGDPINPTASVLAVDGCKITTPAVPGVPAPPSTPAPAPTPPTTPTPVPATTTPRVTPTPQTIPPSARTDVVVGGAGAFRSIGRWRFVGPVTLLKSSSNNVAANVTQRIGLRGVAGLNAQSTGALVRLSAYGSSSGSLVVHACNESPAGATTVTVGPGATAYASSAVKVTNGEICVTSTATAAVRVELVAQLDANGAGAQPISTRRAFDSRVAGRLAANTAVPISAAMLGVPDNSTAVSASFSVVGSAAAGVLSIGPCGDGVWQAAFVAGATTSVSGVMLVNSAGFCVTSSVATDLVVDVTGYFAPGTGMLSPVTSLRRFDSRTTGTTIGSPPASVMIPGFDDWAATTPTAQVHITMIGGAAEASVFAWPCGQPQPAAAVGVVRSRAVNTVSAIVALSNGTLCLASSQPIHIIVDLVALGS